MKVLKKVQQIIKSRDFLGNEFKLTHEGSINYKTTSGGCISICVALLALGVIFDFFYKYFDLTNPTVFESLERSSTYLEFDLYKHKYAPIFHIR